MRGMMPTEETVSLGGGGGEEAVNGVVVVLVGLPDADEFDRDR